MLTIVYKDGGQEHQLPTWAKIKWAESAKRNVISFCYFCGGGQVSAFNAHQLLAQDR